MTDDPQTELQQRIREIVTNDPHSWDEAWKQKVTPWDLGDVQPPLKTLIQSKELNLPANGKALVPGCGGGYDPIFLASVLGYEALGLDISSTAIETARKNLSMMENPALATRVQFKDADFFDYNEDKFDLIYDFAFFVAIPPAMRPSWGAQMSKLVKKNGFLITLVSPLQPYTEVGPPFYVRPEHYPEVLGEGWEKVLDREPDNSIPKFVGKQRLVVWKKL